MLMSTFKQLLTHYKAFQSPTFLLLFLYFSTHSFKVFLKMILNILRKKLTYLKVFYMSSMPTCLFYLFLSTSPVSKMFLLLSSKRKRGQKILSDVFEVNGGARISVQVFRPQILCSCLYSKKLCQMFTLKTK